MEKRRAFTLVELLVVISIIALLLAILMPALNAAKKQGQALICKTNLKTIGQAEMLYAVENKNALVWTRGDRPGNAGFYWAAQLWAIYNGTSIPKLGDVNREPITKPQWLYCPSQKTIGGANTWSDVCLNAARQTYWLNGISYSRNWEGQGWFQDGTFCFPNGCFPQGNLLKIRRPSETVANADGFYIHFPGQAGYTDKYIGGVLNRLYPISVPGRVTAYRHGKNDTLNVLLWDGHVANAKNSISDKFRLIP